MQCRSAPPNEAFSALPNGTQEALLDDTDMLSQVLETHIVYESLTVSDLHAGMLLPTANGGELTVSNNGIDSTSCPCRSIVCCPMRSIHSLTDFSFSVMLLLKPHHVAMEISATTTSRDHFARVVTKLVAVILSRKSRARRNADRSAVILSDDWASLGKHSRAWRYNIRGSSRAR